MVPTDYAIPDFASLSYSQAKRTTPFLFHQENAV